MMDSKINRTEGIESGSSWWLSSHRCLKMPLSASLFCSVRFLATELWNFNGVYNCRSVRENNDIVKVD